MGLRAQNGTAASRDKTRASRKLRDWRSGNIERGSGQLAVDSGIELQMTLSNFNCLLSIVHCRFHDSSFIFSGCLFQQAPDDFAGVDAFGLRGEGRDDAMREDRDGDLLQ